MRILHTADWHLGHRLYNRDRTPEHRAALDWLLQTIETAKIDLLIVAGDVFDVTNPSNQAKELYYEFLAGLKQTCCASAVIVGGNHDSASLLDAPRDLLRALDLHVVGGADTCVSKRVFTIRGQKGKAIVAAVPYLRERDLRKARFGESNEERLTALQEGIERHFTDIAAAAQELRGGEAIPIVATGHLFAGGASDDEEKKSYIYQADENNIEASRFPACFDYVALGHVHRAQHVGGQDRIRYAGSLIPLTFVEGQRPRSVRVVELGAAGAPVSSYKLPLPFFRPLLRLKAELKEVESRLIAAVKVCEPTQAVTWAEVRVKTDSPLPNLRDKLVKVIEKAHDDPTTPLPIELVRISRERITPLTTAEREEEVQQLDELQPKQVFAQLCTGCELPAGEIEQLLEDFVVLHNWWSERRSA
jgi:exonuclease SbcD